MKALNIILTETNDFSQDNLVQSMDIIETSVQRFLRAAVAGISNLRNVGVNRFQKIKRTQEGRMRKSVSNVELDHNATPKHVARKMIQYTLPYRDLINLSVYNLTGQLIETLVEGQQDPGAHSIPFNVGGLPSGKYLYILRVGDRYHSNVMTLH